MRHFYLDLSSQSLPCNSGMVGIFTWRYGWDDNHAIDYRYFGRHGDFVIF